MKIYTMVCQSIDSPLGFAIKKKSIIDGQTDKWENGRTYLLTVIEMK